MEDHPVIVGVIAALLTIGFVDMLKAVFSRSPDELRAADMVSKTLRERWERKYIAYKLCVLLEEMYLNKHLTAARRDYWYQTIGNRCNLLDLLPPRMAENFPDPDEVKRLILARSPGLKEKLPLVRRKPATELFTFRRSSTKEV